MTTTLSTLFADPPREFGILPFWFWNDDLEEAELLRQLHEFHAKGLGGVLIHPRVGLSRRVGYLTEEYFRLVKLVVTEAARLALKVVLYDEGSYPSGSAAGQVVAENPAYAARCLIAKQHLIEGPAQGFWHPNPGRGLSDELLAVVAGREVAPNVIDPTSLRRLPLREPELAHYDLPAGNWRLIAIWHVYSGGTIRGVYAEADDQHALAPAAGDLLNPEAVACFLRLTHDRYYAHLREHFGTTVVAMFTDEPSVLGRGVKRGPHPWPYTPGFLADLQRDWDEDVLCWLPALWLDCGPETESFRQHYTRTVYTRLERTFYGAQNRWCADHGIALTGHPAESNDFGALRQFHWPGQDMVWRWVTPDSPAALEGPHSCAPKCASSAALLQQSPRNGSEALGAYGWQLTLDEAKWLLDWHLVRGNNLFFLHAAFYSVRGRRAFESEPDIGLHNVWWPHFQLLGDYLRRLCWLLSDGEEQCTVAILTDGNAAAWNAAKVLYQNQIDFLYVDDQALTQAQVDGTSLCIGTQQLRCVICDPPRPSLPPLLAHWADAGGALLATWEPSELVTAVVNVVGRDVEWPNAPDLRVIHYQKMDRDFYFLVNEGENTLAGELALAATGALAYWNPLDGTTTPWPGVLREGRLYTRLCLRRRESAILAVDPHETPQPDAAVPPLPGECLFTLAGPWQLFDEQGQPVAIPCPGDWAIQPGWETYAGRLCAVTDFTLTPAQIAQALFLDLGEIGDIAEVEVNGVGAGLCAWAPYLLRIDHCCQPGANHLAIWVTNSSANFYEGIQRPSGLLGPVQLRRGATQILAIRR
ncbi:MAG: hypothetical protein R3C14_54125 [Caldilineaceae bacterium]